MIGGFEQARYNPKHPNMENYIDLVQRSRRIIASWLGNVGNTNTNSNSNSNSNSNGFKWTNDAMSYGDEVIFFREYCLSKPGCQVILISPSSLSSSLSSSLLSLSSLSY